MLSVKNITEVKVGDLIATYNEEGDDVLAVVTELSKTDVWSIDIEDKSDVITEGDICHEIGSFQKGQIYVYGNAERLVSGESYEGYFGETKTLNSILTSMVKSTIDYIKNDY